MRNSLSLSLNVTNFHSCLGERVASGFFKTMELERREYRKKRDECKNVEEFIRFLNEDTLLSSGQYWYNEGAWDFEYDRYKRQRIRQPSTSKDEIQEFEEYRRARLEHIIKRLPGNRGELEVEGAKIIYKNIIDRYPFLQEIVSNVCPRLFQTTA